MVVNNNAVTKAITVDDRFRARTVLTILLGFGTEMENPRVEEPVLEEKVCLQWRRTLTGLKSRGLEFHVSISVS